MNESLALGLGLLVWQNKQIRDFIMTANKLWLQFLSCLKSRNSDFEAQGFIVMSIH